LIHGGINAPLVPAKENIKKPNRERLRLRQLCGIEYYLNKTHMPPPKGRFGKLLMHAEEKTHSAFCYESEIAAYMNDCHATVGNFNGKKIIVEQ